MSEKRAILITGACGFVGRHLVNTFADAGHTVTATDIKCEPWRDDVTFVEADIRDRDVIVGLLEGKDSVIHNASMIHTKRSMQQIVWDVNLGGAQNILAGCEAHGVQKLVYISSASTVYEGRSIENGDETMPYSSVSQAAYADSKIQAEKELLAAASDKLGVVAVRPHVIFGPYDQRFLPAILKRAKEGRMKFSVGWKTWLSDFTYVDNLVSAVVTAEERVAPGHLISGQAYFVTNGEPKPFFEFVAEVLEQLDLPPMRYKIPFAVAYAAAAVKEGIENMGGGTFGREDNLSRFSVKYMCTHHYFSVEKARKDLDYNPAINIDEGIRRTVAHLREQGWN